MEKKEFLRETAGVIIAVTVFAVMFRGFLTLLSGPQEIEYRTERARSPITAQNAPEGYESAEEETEALRVYVEGDGTPPEWYHPDEEMAVEWESCEITESDNFSANSVGRNDVGCLDCNTDTTLYGWDGRTMETWEMDVFARIFYLEFWQPNLTLCEAGCDAMFRLWETEGGTMYETLSRVNENGTYAFSTYPGMWEEDYDPEGLAWCRAYCEERFYEGPEWTAQYFRKGQYHDWGEWSPIPAYEIGGIYFSVGR